MTKESTNFSNAANAKRSRNKARKMWFWIGYSKILGALISVRLKKLHNKHKIMWLRNLMSYHKYTKLGKKFNSDLTGKVMEGILDKDLRDRKYNCNTKSLMVDGSWIYNGERHGSVWITVQML